MNEKGKNNNSNKSRKEGRLVWNPKAKRIKINK